ncbi:hypothetical protein FB451DRAFT_1047161 [Mycena latifolia]|nr:hypothetical protein FB451DRAFT_1047161 [Mycena latifolia]
MLLLQYVTTKCLLTKIILNQMGDRNDMTNSIESRVAFLDHHLIEYVNTLPPYVSHYLAIECLGSAEFRFFSGDGPNKSTFTEKWILRQAVKPFVTEEIYTRKKMPFNPPPRCVATGPAPLQGHLRKRITPASVERLGVFNWPYIRGILAEYLDYPAFLAQGAIDDRARVLMTVLSFIVLQERFHVPAARLEK